MLDTREGLTTDRFKKQISTSQDTTGSSDAPTNTVVVISIKLKSGGVFLVFRFLGETNLPLVFLTIGECVE